ncbi:MAG: dihydroorotase [Deltaproteobacteria bacterium RIFCSPLOWO2_12_FULL_43_16]|nr:MAG: dihydroorotase [Deltaproteobacteria bacterium GWA2_43_19]OGQ11963.1 MAG: dihydroorotase [Deltaproteobacteria bacterium RIFCSPHIGHO2_02_FULL_43_33]OGQ42417.1 MAG: dihydroorotase [Deltaproteobacteria bacterium RIFCSPLOWO2_01_FULL_42_9]OGQ61457.1 MAG: dihydroorotase [Deltaproteobacteria bacterium RIFCSPLOWO2_12_FULL_43_16]HBR18423.1 dihydroorotase [Deltaproteobacteria bacterium]
MLIKGGRVIDPVSGIDGLFDVYVFGGKIAAVKPSIPPGSPLEKGGVGDLDDWTIIDATGLIVCPGFIDMHTHLREPGYEYKETIKTGAMAAAAGGFTSIACMANTNPVNDNASVTRYILKKAVEEGVVNVFPVGAISKGLKGETLAEIGDLKEAGCVAVSDDGRPMMNTGLMRLAMEYAGLFNLLVISHCEDMAISAEGVMNEGFTATRLGLKGIPNAAEDIMVARDIALAELTGAKLHIAHVSTKGSVELIRRAKDNGIRISAEVTPHHFTLKDEAVIGYNTNAKMNPPLRSQSDVDALKQGLKDGTIDVIATDHAPQDIVEKEIEFDKAANGIIGLETALSLSLMLVSDNIITLPDLVKKLSANPAKLLGLDNKGALKVGADADVTIIDLNKEWIVDSRELKSKSRNTPFDGWRMKGRAVKTIVGGKVVYEG